MLLHVLVFEQPQKPENCFRRKIFEFSQSAVFTRTVRVIIVMNTLAIMSVYEGMHPHVMTAFVIANHVCGLLQLAEICVKLLAFGPTLFFFRCMHPSSQSRDYLWCL